MIAIVLAVTVLPTVRASAEPTDGSGTEAGSSDWRQVSAGNGHTCGIRRSGRLYCWGNDTFGELGNGGDAENTSTPTQVAGNATNWTSVDAGGAHTCALRTTGRLYCWGRDTFGQLGDGAPIDDDQTTPTEVAGNVTTWASVSAGGLYTCARRTSGRLFCWGTDSSGQLGNGPTATDQPAPVPVAGNLTTWSSVSVGPAGGHTCGRRTSGRLFCWGSDSDGKLGNGGADVDAAVPVQVAGGRTDWASVSVGYFHTCGLRTSGRLFCWGDDSAGELGDGGTPTDASKPVQVFGGLTTWTSVSAGAYYTCGRRRSGQLWCWGYDGQGQVGDGSPAANRYLPFLVFGGATDWIGPTAGYDHACARTTSGRAYCWGSDNAGALGDGAPDVDQFEPSELDP